MGMNEEKPQAEYSCSEQDLYTGVETAWKSYQQKVTDFTGWKTTYTPQMAIDQLAALAAAKAMPDEAQRNASHSVLNKELRPLSEDCLIVWKQLESYIRDGFPALIFQDMLNAAGYGFYEAASNEDWESVKGLMNDGKIFIAAKAVELGNGGMPAGFDSDFDDAKQDFEDKYSDFLQEEEHAREQRDAKVTANNQLYRACTAMCQDGQKIFRKNAAVREQFTWSKIQALIKANRAKHAVQGTVSEVDGPVIGGASVQVLDKDGVAIEGFETVTADDGTFKIAGLKNGEYKLQVDADGHVGVVIPFVVDGGPVTVDVEMNPS